MLGDKQIWWQVRNAAHAGVALTVLWCVRLRGVYTAIKDAPRRSPKVRRIEIIVATGLWTFILLAVIVFLFATGFRG